MDTDTFDASGVAVLRGGGEMGALMRAIDWSRTAVGPVATWPQSLRTALSILLETGFPMYIAWGPEYTQFYNDGYRPILGSTKHPAAMGASTRQTFAEIWDIIGPMFAGVMQGTPTTVVDFMLPLDRHGFTEECYFIFSYSPIRQESGEVGGVLVTVTETTARVIGERRLHTTQALAARTRDARTVDEACAISTSVLNENRFDIPFAAVYLVAGDTPAVRLAGLCGSASDADTDASVLDDVTLWPFEEVLASRTPKVVDAPHGFAHDTRRVLVTPITQHGSVAPIGVLVAGLSPRVMFDAGYQDFLTTVASQIGTAVASARTLEEAEARAAALAELDRAKTAFFSNVSHEFRTPLTLMLGPTESAISAPERVLRGDDLETVHRNAQRLLKLVNALLDFSRIEAGRMRAQFEPTDLAVLTAELASAFRSATERAGLELVVDCPPLPEAVFVDRTMWEKVVLNLLSNAFKFTFTGRITVALAWQPPVVTMSVTDTGVGIAAEDLPHVFDRFRRVERVRARTHEGSGIGLALVRELVAMHGGRVDVSSQPGQGTTFTVSIPAGSAHLPAEHIDRTGEQVRRSGMATAYVQEALRWLPGEGPSSSAAATHEAVSAGYVLVADDNSDMRDYIARLLAGRWRVATVGDGHAALQAARVERPDVIVADVMMPGLDGFGLLRAVRADPHLRVVPVVLVSARAGEEAQVEGLQAGADDYLVKPFTARELVARVQAQILRSRIRSVQEEHAVRLASIFEHAPVGVAILRGPAHVFEFANRAYVAMIGGREVAGQPVRQALPELAGQGLYELLDQVFASGEPHVGRAVRVMLNRHPAGSVETFFDFVYQPLMEQQKVSGIAVVCFEVTELAQARREAETASRAKDEFLAMLGHELRNPLAPILTALQLMQLRGVSGAERERTIIERQVKHVVGLVDDLLDVSRIARGKVQLRRQPLELATAIAKAIEMTGPAIEERHHTLIVHVPSGLMIDADPARVAQVFANLLANAAKYTDGGGIIRLSAVADGSDVVVAVADNGSGITPEMLPRVFDLFIQEGQALERTQGGLGIGLAIVRSLVEAHGGSVTASSTGKGSGATFTVRLPLSRGELPQPVMTGTPASHPTTRRRVLVVDDNVDAAEMLAYSLTSLGHDARAAHDGPAALELARSFHPDVALLDLGLPVMDGFELAQQLKALRPGEPLTLVAITGYAQEIDRRRTRASGFDAHYAKPVDVHELDEMLRTRREASSGEVF